MTPEDKQKAELEAIELLNEEAGLGLSGLRSLDVGQDPPDVEGILEGRRIGIEVRSLIDESDQATEFNFRNVVLLEVARLASNAGPGRVGFGRHSLRLVRAVRKFSNRLAEVTLRLAEMATAPGDHVVAAAGDMLESLEVEYRKVPGRWKISTVPLPSGIELALFVRDNTRPLAVRQLTASLGVWLSTVAWAAEPIREKAADLARWVTSYDERWLVLPATHSKVSVEGARFETQRFPGTGFDRIYLMDTPGTVYSTPGLRYLRLDLP